MIKLENVVKSYPVAGEDLIILKDINLSIDRGEFVAIMGPSGSGKSTLMNIIGCLDQPTTGKYFLNGKLVSDHDENELAHVRNQSVGFVFQQFQLLPRLTALQNVELPMIYAGVEKKERIERAKEALAKVGLADRMDHLPNALSGGQKQRVAIARSIVNNPDIILADEPTGALDSKTGVQIMEMFRLLHQEGTTIILVTHEAEIASYAHRTIFVRDGMLTSAEKIVNQEVLEQVLALEAEKSGKAEKQAEEELEFEAEQSDEVEKQAEEELELEFEQSAKAERLEEETPELESEQGDEAERDRGTTVSNKDLSMTAKDTVTKGG